MAAAMAPLETSLETSSVNSIGTFLANALVNSMEAPSAPLATASTAPGLPVPCSTSRS